MRAVGVREFGTAPEVIDIARPDPGPEEILVRVEAAGLNPVDGLIASGAVGAFDLPLVLGVDFSGRVEAVGGDVGRFSVGDAVFGKAPYGTGTYTEYVVVPGGGAVVPAPDAVELKTAAALPTAAMTALAILDRAEVRGGESMLVIGAAGGVGTYLTQLASARDVRVLAVTRGDESVRMGLFGAAVTIDANRESVRDRVSRDEYPEGVDVLVDLVSDNPADFRANAALVHDGGVAVTTRGAAQAHAERGVEEVNLHFEATSDLLAAVAKEVDSGTLRVYVESEVPLEGAAQALARNRAGGARGKTIIKP
jgi:NADPH:quinone reductase-like Zn-dependent oxidoreductase